MTSGVAVVFQGGMTLGRLIIRVSADTRMAVNNQGDLDFNYLTLTGGQTMVLDPPNLFRDDTLFFRLDSASSGVIEIVRA